MFQSICEILTFKTPFDELNDFLEKYEKLITMFEDYILNSGTPLEKIEKKDVNYDIFFYQNEEIGVNIIFKINNNLKNNPYFPFLKIEYFLSPYKFEKENIEFFLNDNIKFIFNILQDQFFIDYDEKYKINDINKGKKIDYIHLTNFDIKDKKSHKNKLLLDSMMYLYYNNIINLAKIENLNFENQDNYDILSKSLEIGQLRVNDKKAILLEQTQKLRSQIDFFITSFSV